MPGILALLSTAAIAAADYTNASFVLDGAGHWSSGGTYSNISAVAQPGGVGISTDGSLRNHAGFLNTFVLRPDLDTDGDGLANEWDADNDNDGLVDETELAGTAFSPTSVTDPNSVDTDGDEADDGAEAVAGTNPLNENARFEIVWLASDEASANLGWVARGGKTYAILAAQELADTNAFSAIGTTNVTGGVAPWYVVTNDYTDLTIGSATTRFYTVEVLP